MKRFANEVIFAHMLRKILAISLLGSVATAQSATPGQSKEPCEVEVAAGEVAVTAVQHSYYDVLPRGKRETVAIVPYVAKNKYGCCPFTATPNQQDMVPVSIELTEPDGLSVLYKKGHHYQRMSQDVPISFLQDQKFVLLKIRADRTMSLGDHRVKGIFTFKKVQNGKLGSAQQIAVEIPIKVAEHDAKVENSEWPFEPHIARDVRNVVLLPVEIPAMILLAIACHTGSGCDL